MRVLGVIPARGGSKSIHLKNIVDVCGIPLIAYSIKSAVESELLEDLIISTDNLEIAKVAKEYGGKIPFIRPSELATDSASSIDVIRHALKFMENANGVVYDACMLLQPTNPLRSSSLIDLAINIFSSSRIDSVVSMVSVGAAHPYRMYSLTASGALQPFVKNLENPMLPRQELPPIYIRSGDIYLTSRNVVLNGTDLIGEKSQGLIIEPENTVNIDSEQDLVVARSLIKSRKNSNFGE
jgi:CMP-N-acetylneuraminic acid synthetase